MPAIGRDCFAERDRARVGRPVVAGGVGGLDDLVAGVAEGGASAVRRPWLGARVQSVTPDIAESMGLDHPTGVLVASLQAKSPAEEAGLKRGDLIRVTRRTDKENDWWTGELVASYRDGPPPSGEYVYTCN